MSTSLLSRFAIWSGEPRDIFPDGSHVFAADLDALRELAEVLREDLREEHLIPLDLVARAQATESIETTDDPDLVRRFALPRLLDFLRRRRPAFDRAAHPRIVENTLRHGRDRLERLRALDAPEVLIDHTTAELARIEAPGWSPASELETPNAVAVAAVVDVRARVEHDWPLVVDADITALVLLAAQCCVAPEAQALEEAAWIDALEWTPLVEEREDEAPVPPEVVRVRPALYAEAVERLELAIVPPEQVAAVGARALLAVATPMPEED